MSAHSVTLEKDSSFPNFSGMVTYGKTGFEVDKWLARWTRGEADAVTVRLNSGLMLASILHGSELIVHTTPERAQARPIPQTAVGQIAMGESLQTLIVDDQRLVVLVGAEQEGEATGIGLPDTAYCGILVTDQLPTMPMFDLATAQAA
jgi:hypothetical protein